MKGRILEKMFIVKNSKPASECYSGRDHSPWAGVYFLIDGDEIVYIGRSGMLRTRLFDHMRTKKFTNVFFIACDDEDGMALIENKYIAHFKPVMNKAGVTMRLPKIAANLVKEG